MTSETRSRTPVTTGCNEADDESGDFTVVLVLCACSNDPHVSRNDRRIFMALRKMMAYRMEGIPTPNRAITDKDAMAKA